jgi:cytochrome c nitrite reductase small subunit
MKSSARLVLAAVITGIPIGVGAFTFHYGEGLSYFSTDPAACANCHIMQSNYDSWQKSSHHSAATCVDCHLPHDFVGKYLAKADNGYRHSKGFTMQDFHEPILINSSNSHILQENCISCHQDMTHNLLAGATTDRDAVSCVHCHSSVGHGPATGVGGPDQGEKSEMMVRYGQK